MDPGFTFGPGELAAVALATSIIGVWAALRYGRTRSRGAGDRDG